MDTFLSAKSQDDTKVKPSQVLGGALGWIDEIGFEMETPSVSSVAKGIGSVFEDIFSLGQDIAGVEVKSAAEQSNKFPSQGSIEFKKAQVKVEEDKKKQEAAGQKRVFYQALKEDQLRAQQAKDRLLFEEEINDIATNLPTDEKNRLLHYQASYKDRSIYQRAELRRKIIEERRKADQQQKEVSIPSPAKQPSALEGAFEGRSGSQGSGTSNLSANAAG